MLLKKSWRILAIVLSILGLTGLAVALTLFLMDISYVKGVPAYSPFLGLARFTLLSAGLIIIFLGRPLEDEYMRQLNWQAFKYSITPLALLLVINQAAYFVTNPPTIQAIDAMLLQVWLQIFIFRYFVKRAGS